MVVRIVEILLEYIAIILCIHKIIEIKLNLNKWNIILGIINLCTLLCVSYGILAPGYRGAIYLLLVLYIKFMQKKSWSRAIGNFGIMMIIIVLLQVVAYYALKIFYITINNNGVVINGICILALGVWRREYTKFVIDKINTIKILIILILYLFIFYHLFYLCKRYGYLSLSMIIQFVAEIAGLSVVTILWVSSELLNRHRIREVQMYKMYNKAFEETIDTIRMRQHEFENHVNTMKCLRYVIRDEEELFRMQEQYYDSVLQDASINQLLKLRMEPTLIGFLYSKITAAGDKGISVRYDIQPIEVNNYVLVYELIEILGILFDNAVEALEQVDDKHIMVRIVNEEERFYFEVANKSRPYQNYEIEKFVKCGYSTKGENRGIGLARVKEIAKKYKTVLEIKNYMHETGNYLSFGIRFRKRKER